MKRASTLWLLLLVLLSAASCVGRDGRFGSIFGDPRAVEGTWYLNGERDKRTEIISTRDGYAARNERGKLAGWKSAWAETSALEIGKTGCAVPSAATVSTGKNGTRWTREPSR